MKFDPSAFSYAAQIAAQREVLDRLKRDLTEIAAAVREQEDDGAC